MSWVRIRWVGLIGLGSFSKEVFVLGFSPPVLNVIGPWLDGFQRSQHRHCDIVIQGDGDRISDPKMGKSAKASLLDNDGVHQLAADILQCGNLVRSA